MAGSAAAARGSKAAGSTSAGAPLSRSTTTCRIGAKRASISSGASASSGAASPAATSTLRCMSSVWLIACRSRNATADDETTTAHATQTSAANPRL